MAEHAGPEHRLTERAAERLRYASTATITTQLLHRGYRNTFLSGIHPLRSDLRMVGYAFTLRYVPAREDVGMLAGQAIEDSVQWQAVEAVGKDEVLVIDAARRHRRCVLWPHPRHPPPTARRRRFGH